MKIQSEHVPLLILGAGLSGLSVANAVGRVLGREKVLLLEREAQAGGLCRSETIEVSVSINPPYHPRPQSRGSRSLDRRSGKIRPAFAAGGRLSARSFHPLSDRMPSRLF